MAESYSPSLKLTLIGDGDLSGTWGDTTNVNLGTLLEQAITGVVTIPMGDSNITLTNLNGVSDQARNAVLVATGTNSAIRQLIIPLVNKLYVVYNNTSGGYAITIGGSTGNVVSIPNGVTAQVYCDGTNTYSSQTGSAGNFVVNGTLTASGVTDTGNVSVGGNLTVTGTSTINGAITHNSTAVFNGTTTHNTTITVPTVATSDSSTNAASTALVQNKINSISTVPTATNINTGSGWQVYQSGSKLYFVWNGNAVASLDSGGNWISAGNVSAYTAP